MANSVVTLSGCLDMGLTNSLKESNTLNAIVFTVVWLFIFILYSTLHKPCEQSLSKTHQRASRRGFAEIVSSLLSRAAPVSGPVTSLKPV